METNYYNRSNNFSAPIRKEPKPYTPKYEEKTFTKQSEQENIHAKDVHKSLLKSLKNDDLLILGIIFLLYSESESDHILLLILAYIFLSNTDFKL